MIARVSCPACLKTEPSWSFSAEFRSLEHFQRQILLATNFIVRFIVCRLHYRFLALYLVRPIWSDQIMWVLSPPQAQFLDSDEQLDDVFK
jgi:hypothetical protein